MLAYDFFCFARKVSVARKSRIQLTWILVHYWPMRVPVRLNFTKVCLNFFMAFCSWLVTGWRFGCKYALSCFSFLFQQRIRQASERNVSTKSDQFSFKEKKGRRVQHLARNVFFRKVMARIRDERQLPCADLIGVMHFDFTPISLQYPLLP